MTRPLASVVLVGCILSACSAAPTPPAAVQKIEPIPAPASIARVPNPLSPRDAAVSALKTVFKDVPECVASGFTKTQCLRAQGVASAMVSAVPAVYTSISQCQAFFKSCMPITDIAGKDKVIPNMDGFSMGTSKPGVDTAPDASHPVFYLPVYLNQQGQWVYIEEGAKGDLVARRVVK